MAERSSLTALDWIGGVVALAATFSLAAFSGIGGTFAAMYTDLGGPLPALTRLVLEAWFPLALALVPGGMLGAAARVRGLGACRALIVLAFVVATASLVLCIVGAYLPIFAVSGAVQGD